VPVGKSGHALDPILGHRDAGRVSGDGTACPGNGGYTIVHWLRGQARARVQYGDPLGNMESVRRIAPDKARLTGWALDPETSDPIAVHLYRDGGFLAAFTAFGERPDIGRVYHWLGSRHGYVVDIPVPLGTHLICAYGISVGTGTNELVGCGGTSGRPFGSFDRLQRRDENLRVRGWAIDPDVVRPIAVHVYVDGHWVREKRARKSRPDVGDAFPAWGPNHGYDITFPASPAAHQVCIYGISRGPDPNTLLHCRTIGAAT
jgi:hypothetical protein